MPDFTLKQVGAVLTELSNRGFYGELLIKMQNGQVKQCVKTESVSPGPAGEGLQIFEAST